MSKSYGVEKKRNKKSKQSVRESPSKAEPNGKWYSIYLESGQCSFPLEERMNLSTFAERDSTIRDIEIPTRWKELTA